MADVNQIMCPNCGQSYAVQPEQWPQYHGQTINCTKCGKPFTVTARGGMVGQQQTPPPVLQQPGVYPPPAGGPQSPFGAYPGQGQPYGNVPPQGNGWAITSLVFGILGCCCILPGIGGIVAIITGIVGLNKTRDSRVGGKGMSVAGISLGGVSFLVVIPLLISILLPALNRAREQANRIKCASNMKQIALAIAMYSNNERGQAFPPDLKTLYETQDLNAAVFNCPSSNDTPAPGTSKATIAANILAPGHESYIYIGDGMTASVPPDAVVLYENSSDHLNEGMNVLFGDFHVEWVNKAGMQSILDQRAAGKKIIVVP